MNEYFLNLKQTLTLVLAFIAFSNFSAQNPEQARGFINRSHIAICKVQKEMLKSGSKDLEAEIKKGMKYQVIALKLFKENKLKDAVGYSYKSRMQCVELLGKLDKPSADNFNLNDDEKTYCKAPDFTNLNLKPGLIDAAENKKIEDLEILNYPKFREIELSIK